MVAKAEMAEIRDILTLPADEPVEKTEPDEVVEEETVVEAVEETVVDEVEATADTTQGDDIKTYTPDKLAEAIGWDTSDVYNDIVIPMKDGENVPLGEFKNKYQDLAHDNAQLQTQLEEAKTGLEQAQTGVTQTQKLSQEMITQLGYLDSINRTEKGTDWDELESLDPTEAILQRDKIRRARDEVQANLREIEGKELEANQLFKQQSYAKMLDLIPEWKDEAVLVKDQDAMKAVMRTYGFDDRETNSIMDPRQMKLLRRLSYLENKNKDATDAVKKVRAAPRSLKGRKVEAASNTDKVNELVTKAKQSGDKRDEHAAVKALLAQG